MDKHCAEGRVGACDRLLACYSARIRERAPVNAVVRKLLAVKVREMERYIQTWGDLDVPKLVHEAQMKCIDMHLARIGMLIRKLRETDCEELESCAEGVEVLRARRSTRPFVWLGHDGCFEPVQGCGCDGHSGCFGDPDFVREMRPFAVATSDTVQVPVDFAPGGHEFRVNRDRGVQCADGVDLVGDRECFLDGIGDAEDACAMGVKGASMVPRKVTRVRFVW
jgi:hypothetical protein